LLFSGRGVDTDIIVASAKAYMQALNKMIAAEKDAERGIAEVNKDGIAITAG
jgi:2-isopropylmalate synthase